MNQPELSLLPQCPVLKNENVCRQQCVGKTMGHDSDSNLEHMKALDGFAELRGVARRFVQNRPQLGFVAWTASPQALGVDSLAAWLSATGADKPAGALAIGIGNVVRTNLSQPVSRSCLHQHLLG